MKSILKLLCAIILCQLAGILGSIFTADAIPTWYAVLEKPFFSPPNWVFGPVWTILYALMGISFFLVWKKGFSKKNNKIFLKIFTLQLMLNFLWSVVFFGLQSPELGLLTIVVLWLAIAATIKCAYLINRWSAYLLIPYIVWVSFATVLNLAITLLN